MRIFVASLSVVIGLCGVSAQSDLDELMSQVLSRRDENWKKLQQYVLEEREAFQLAATGGARLYGFERDYSWFVREGFFIRSPIRADGVTIGEGDRRRAEDEWLARQRRRETRRAARDGTTSELTNPAAPAGSIEDVLKQSIEPQFIQAAYFLRFKFDPGQYALVGPEQLGGQARAEDRVLPDEAFLGRPHAPEQEPARARRPDRRKDEQVVARHPLG